MSDNYTIVTVATEPKGKFNDLVNNDFNTEVVVLGMGEKWTGFEMKNRLVNEFISDLEDDDVVIFVDGYDSEIKRNPSEAYRVFTSKNYKMLVSSDFSNSYGSFSKWMTKKMYGTPCRNSSFANSGMYMGKVKYLKEYFTRVSNNKCKDDQYVLNTSCEELDFIQVDEKEEIFQNFIPYLYSPVTEYNDKAVFVSYPAQYTFERYSRFYFEYAQFFLWEILLGYLLLVVLFLMLAKSKNTRFISIFTLTLFLVILLANADYSCI